MLNSSGAVINASGSSDEFLVLCIVLKHTVVDCLSFFVSMIELQRIHNILLVLAGNIG